MLKKSIASIQKEVSMSTLFQNVQEISRFHRIQASEGYRDGAKYCLSYLQKQGIDAQILQYPANKTAYAGTHKMFQEWNIQEAYCDLVYPKTMRIADVQIEPISIIQKSYPCDYRKQPLDVIIMDKGMEEENYSTIDFTGKLVFIHEHFENYQWTLQRGALGFISDFINVDGIVRSREELYNVLNYTSFWWKHTPEEIPAFGFVVTPQLGDKLSKLALRLHKDYEMGKVASPYLQMCPYVDAKLFDGHIDVVEATLQGKSDECILVSAHLCHPSASANDNASGVAGGMELLRVLSSLQKKKQLPLLEKTIKLILIPEFTGTYCYISDGRDLRKYIAGINLDMIGGRQENMYGPITITNLPYACPSFVDSLASLLASIIKTPNDTKESYQMSLVHTKDVPFQLGSDHFILSDPMVNIPSIMLGQWPDTFYHTSGDTLDIIDPIVLKYATVLGCSYVYALANYEQSTTPLLIKQMRLQFIKALNLVQANPYQEDAYTTIYQFFKASLDKLAAFTPTQASILSKEQEHFTQIFQMYASSTNTITQKYPQIPIRLFHTPIVDVKDVILNNKAFVNRYEQYQKAYPIMQKEHALLQVLCDYYVDGKRSIDEIGKSVCAEAGYGMIEDIYAYIVCMCELNLMRLS